MCVRACVGVFVRACVGECVCGYSFNLKFNNAIGKLV